MSGLTAMMSAKKLHKLVPYCRHSIHPYLCQQRFKFVQDILKSRINGSDTEEELYEMYNYDFPIESSSAENFFNYFYIIVFPYFLLFGTLGNIIGSTLMRRYSNNVWSTCLYMAIAFPLDLIKLYVECGNAWLEKVVSSDTVQYFNLSHRILLLSNAVCKVYNFVYDVILSEVEWIIVAVAIETAIAYKRPSCIYKMCSKERARAVVLFISVMLISLNLHFFWTHGLVRPENDPGIDTYYCNYANELSNKFRDYIWPIINACVEHFIPASIVISCCVMIALKLSNLQKDKEIENKHLEKYFMDVNSLRQLQLAMFITCIFVVISQISNTVFKGIRFQIFEIDYPISLYMTSFLSITTFIINSHKFWIFYICCEKFRKDVKEIGRCICRPFNWSKRRKLKTKTSIPRDTTLEATVSWRESETSFTRVTGDSKMTEMKKNIC